MHIPQKSQKPISSLNELKEKIKGYLFLTIQKSNIKKRLAMVEIKGQKYYVIGGIYIFPYAASLIKNNRQIINGMILDTTWRCLPYYVTSILMSCVYNVGLPLSFSFGNSEDKPIYNYHFNSFKKLFNIELEQFKFESDQGPALKGVFKDRKIEHCFCMRHFLHNLKFNAISYDIGVIVKCCTEFELKNSINLYSKKFSELTEESDIKLRDTLLKKAGLKFCNVTNRIVFNNFEKWKKVSLLERVKMRLPSTTNSLEATHGQLNAKTPRKKNFWQTLYEIIQNLNTKNETFTDHIKHNYQFEKRRTFNDLKNKSPQRILDEAQKYLTQINSCQCSQNKLISALYSMDIPCHHRIFKECPYPECPIPKLIYQNDTDELIDKYKYLPDEEKKILTMEEQDKIYIADIIRKFGKFKDLKKIKEYVDQNYKIKDNEIYINCKPSSVLEFIHDAILHFRHLALNNTQ